MLDSLRIFDWHTVQYLVNLGTQYPWFGVIEAVCAELLIILFVPVLYVLWRTPQPVSKHQGNKKAVVLALLALVFAVAIKTLIGMLYFRARPFVSHPELLISVSHLDPQSFPSGHVLVATTITMSLWLSGMRKLAPWLAILTLLIAFGRVAIGVHYPTDVLGAMFIGVVTAWLLHHESSGIKHYLPES